MSYNLFLSLLDIEPKPPSHKSKFPKFCTFLSDSACRMFDQETYCHLLIKPCIKEKYEEKKNGFFYERITLPASQFELKAFFIGKLFHR